MYGDIWRIYADQPLPLRLFLLGRGLLGRLAETLTHTPPLEGKVLDFGCGHGVQLNLLHKQGKVKKAVGVDIDASRIRIAQSKAPPGIEFSSRRPSELEADFDVILICDVLCLIPLEKWGSLFADFRKKLKPGGRLLIKDGLRKRNWKHLLCTMEETLACKWFKWTSCETKSFAFRTLKEWQEFLPRNGFRIERVAEFRLSFHNHFMIWARKEDSA